MFGIPLWPACPWVRSPFAVLAAALDETPRGLYLLDFPASHGGLGVPRRRMRLLGPARGVFGGYALPASRPPCFAHATSANLLHPPGDCVVCGKRTAPRYRGHLPAGGRYADTVASRGQGRFSYKTKAKRLWDYFSIYGETTALLLAYIRDYGKPFGANALTAPGETDVALFFWTRAPSRWSGAAFERVPLRIAPLAGAFTSVEESFARRPSGPFCVLCRCRFF